MITVKDILDYTESFAPLCTAADFDNCGLLVGNTEQEVTKVIVALDITAEVVREAKGKGVQLIISHHPVIFNPLKKLRTDSVPYMLAQAGITALCLHTNLDIATEDGVNVCLAKTLGLTNIRVYPEDFVCLGKLPEELTTEEFAQLVKDSLGADCVTYTKSQKKIQTVGMCSGAGGDMYHSAVALGADAFLTGEAKHHEYLEAVATGIPMVVAGHFFTEDIVVAPLAKKLAGKFPEAEFILSDSCKNPYSCI
ncbi:MAG: Nif3-like dinuclear metal center hexameric protein [Ruminococcus sp.]|nr:Nif3-like dinuclear metal center hexameric protein [Ruminococcus sp.]